MLVGVLVAYYKDKYCEALVEYVKLLDSINKPYYLIVVNNTGDELPAVPGVELGNIDIVAGTNTSWEFSGWDEGVKYWKFSYPKITADYYLFANDTFCKHRFFNSFNRSTFASSFVKYYNSKAIVGDVNNFSESYNIFGVEMSGWISTYLFGVSAEALDFLMPFSKVDETSLSVSGNIVDVQGFSSNLNAHLTKWLFPKNGGGWYKSNSESSLIKNKLKAIANEKMLSATAKGMGVEIVNVYSGMLVKKINGIQEKIFGIIR